MGNLSKLRDLNLSNNQLNGSIPPEMGNLINILNLELNFNQLSGSIPSELDNMSSLGTLILSNNQLSGAIPSRLGNLSTLQSLYLDNNLLTGNIPAELSNLDNLTHLWLSENKLSGPIPPALGTMNNLRVLSLFDNQLSGAIPPELGNLSNLWILELHKNELSGSIPSELAHMFVLVRLTLDENRLSGPIPPELGNRANLTTLRLSQNLLTGDMPASFANLVNLKDPGSTSYDGLDLDYNGLNIPPEYPNPTDPLHTFLHQKDPNWHTLQSFEQIIGADGGTLTSLDDRAEFSITADALTSDTTFTFTPQPAPSQEVGALPFANNSFHLSAKDALGQPVTVFDQPITVTINYIDTTILGIPESTLTLYYWDTDSSTWVDAVTTCSNGEYTRDFAGNSFSLPICHLTEFAALGNVTHTYLPLLLRNP